MTRFLLALALCASLTAPAWADETHSQYYARVQAELDPNRDGYITRAEVSSRFPNDTSFGRFDANGDGILVGSEIAAYMSDLLAEVVDACEWTGDTVFENDADENMCVSAF